jgi:protocatechuate 3,4-dioxygenase beta subunit
MRRLWLITALVCVAAVPMPGWPGSLRAQSAPAGSGSRVPGAPQDAADDTGLPEGGRIEGRVLAADSGRPLRRARVRLAAADSRLQRVASTDEQGRYAFDGLPAGRYALRASKAGYVELEYGQRGSRESGRLVTLAGGQSRDGADLRLPSGSVITVRVTDRFGEPLAGAGVQAQQFGYSEDGFRTLVSVATEQSARAVTDDRGETRLYGLMPGEYVLSATPPQSLARLPGDPEEPDDPLVLGYAPTFYPGTITPNEAQAVSVGVGQEAWAQIAMVPTRLARVSGTVVDSSGRPAAGSTVWVAGVAASGTRTLVSARRRTTTDRTGAFALDGVAPGDHQLVVTGASGGGRGGRGGRTRAAGNPETATVPLTVWGADVEDLFVVTGTSATISGRARSTGSPPGDGDESVRPRIRVRQTGGAATGIPGAAGSRTAAVADDGTFTVEDVTGRVLIDVALPEGWALLSVTMGGRYVTDAPVDLAGVTRVSDVVVTITDAVTHLSGSVHDAKGLPVRDGVVVVQPAGRLDAVAAARRARAIRLDEQGRFEMSGLRPGQYVATAVDTLESGAERSPEIRQQLAQQGRSFTLGDAEHGAISLEMAPAR